MGQKIFAVKMAAKFNIRLIFYGEVHAEYGMPVSDDTECDGFRNLSQEQVFLTSTRYDAEMGILAAFLETLKIYKNDKVVDCGVKLLNLLVTYSKLFQILVLKNTLK